MMWQLASTVGLHDVRWYPEPWRNLFFVVCLIVFATLAWMAGRRVFASLLKLDPDKAPRWTSLLAILGAVGGTFAGLAGTLGSHIPVSLDLFLLRGVDVWDVPPELFLLLNLVQLFALTFLPALVLSLCAVTFTWMGQWRASSSATPQGVGDVRATLRRLTVLFAAAVVVLAFLGFGPRIMWPVLEVFALLPALIAAGLPLLSSLISRPKETATSPVPPSPQRDRILRLLEEGKVSAAESVELLAALAQGETAADRSEPLTAPRRALIVGAAMVLVAFFLPWYVINLGEETRRLSQSMGLVLPAQSPFSQGQREAEVSISGGDLQHGLGWILLAAAALAAAAPSVAPNVPLSTRRGVMFLLLGAGTVICLHLMVSGWRWTSVGPWLALAGCAVQWLAGWGESVRVGR